MIDPIEAMLLEAELAVRNFSGPSELDPNYQGHIYDTALGKMVPLPTDSIRLGLPESEETLRLAAAGGNYFYVADEIQVVIEGALLDAPSMYYELCLLPLQIGWMKFSKSLYQDDQGEEYDKVAWRQLPGQLSVVWLSVSGRNFNYVLAAEETKAAIPDIALQTLFVSLHVLAQPIVGSEDYQVRKSGPGRRKL